MKDINPLNLQRMKNMTSWLITCNNPNRNVASILHWPWCWQTLIFLHMADSRYDLSPLFDYKNGQLPQLFCLQSVFSGHWKQQLRCRLSDKYEYLMALLCCYGDPQTHGLLTICSDGLFGLRWPPSAYVFTLQLTPVCVCVCFSVALCHSE